MVYYAAPMEGVTGYIWRNAHHRYYPGISRYYTPFLAPRKKRGCSRKEKNDILPEHNAGIPLVPQVLTNSSEAFISLAEFLADLGYKEVNLNLGCPAGTVVSKGRGSGFLKDKASLSSFFDEVFEEREKRQIPVAVSVKTRLGMEDPDEILPLMRIYNRFPISEVIIHARVRKDMYKYPVRREAFGEACAMSRHPVCYNGDIFTPLDALDFTRQFPQVQAVMLGRGLIGNPELPEEITASTGDSLLTPGSRDRRFCPADLNRFRCFHDEILHGYQEILSGDKNVLFKMKELWSFVYMDPFNQDRTWKKIRKAATLREYSIIIEGWFRSCESSGDIG